jgi:hypothetical protein
VNLKAEYEKQGKTWSTLKTEILYLRHDGRQTRGSKMNDKIIRKYVRDLDGLLKELKGEFVSQTELQVGENAVIFLFGRIYRYLNFYEFVIGHEKALENDLDAWAYLEKENKGISVEFEAQSANFKKDKHDPEKCDLIVCWNDNWNGRPAKIDVFDLESLWKQAQEKS